MPVYLYCSRPDAMSKNEITHFRILLGNFGTPPLQHYSTSIGMLDNI